MPLEEVGVAPYEVASVDERVCVGADGGVRPSLGGRADH